ncbi:PREDICTED: homeobox protein XHOX-7.1' [Ceratosolen solmsi marchali]|uniref:Homeobox protein XHOX-7.1' n=1 Tax=Ceratosolen solmsi marchali TaxID=326594 RepID=A0AAJ6YMW2_9HYME|nr:PREDICTED: homeobox protein XHOX-7.1' [Ceratosolen solmsi marchali]
MKPSVASLEMNGTQRTSFLYRESSDFSIKRILSKNVFPSSYVAFSDPKTSHLLPEQICISLINQSSVLYSLPSLNVQNKFDLLKSFCHTQLSNPELHINLPMPDKILVKSNQTVKRFAKSNSENLNGELSWLRCTRFCPPKLPKSNAGKTLKRKPGSHPRIPFTKHQLNVLENKYKGNAYLSRKDALHLSNILNLQQNRIKIWFQNRRARERREYRILQQTQNKISM